MEHPSRPAFATLLELLSFRASPQSGSADKMAFSFLDDGENVSDTLTFAQLDCRARSLAAQLQQVCAPGDRVLLVYPPGLDYIASFFACAYAGVIAVPALPPANAKTLPRLLLMAEDAQPAVALTLSSIAARVEQMQAGSDNVLTRLRWLAGDALDDAAAQWTPPSTQPSDIAFLQYTSGSTGAPKGVMVSNANILANAHFIATSFPFSAGDTVVSWLPPHHDMGLVSMILCPVYAGYHSVQFPPAAFLMRPYRWLKAASDYQARFIAAPNFAFELCVDKITDEQKAGLKLDLLEYALNGAEPVRPATLRRFAEAFAPCGLRPEIVLPVFGLAEATLFVTGQCKATPLAQRGFCADKAALAADRIEAAASDGVEFVSLGAARMGGHEVCIVEPSGGETCIENVIGEVWVQGPSVAQGYWRREDATAATFHTKIRGREGQWMRTGDLGFLREGQLYIAGRIKEMMIFNGRNIYPQDVERTIESQDPAFRTNGCAVFALEEQAGTRLVVVQELESRREPDHATLASRLRAELAEQHELYDVAAILLVKAGRIPRTSSGKIQRIRCRDLFLGGELDVLWRWDAPVGTIAAATNVAMGADKQALAAIWCEVLDLPSVDMHADFFALGGQSLLATRVLAAVRERMGVELPLRALFDAPNIAALADRIVAARLAPPTTLEPVGGRDAGPTLLSFAQQRLWFLEQFENGAGNYNLSGALRLRGPLDIGYLSQALNGVVARHESLRTTFGTVNGQAVQVIAAATPLPLPVVQLAAAAAEAQLTTLLTQEAAASFDLEHGPLLRARLFVLTDDEHVLALSMHHIIADGWSVGLLINEIAQNYAACESGAQPALTALAVQYADYAAWQRTWFSGDRRASQLDYWRSQLAGAPALLALPTDRPRPACTSYAGAVHHFHIDPTCSAAVAALGRVHGATLFMTLAAAFNVLLARYAGQDDICIGTPVANRPRREFEPLIGFFVNTTVLRTHVNAAASFTELLGQVRAAALAMYVHQDLPFDQLVEALRPERSSGHAPLFQVMLALQNSPAHEISAGALRMRLETIDRAASQFDLTLNVLERDDQLECTFEYSTALFDAARIERMAQHLVTLLAAIVTAPTLPLAGLAMSSDAERAWLASLNQTAFDFCAPQTFHQLFEAQVTRTPEALALICGGERWTYAQLNRQANRLARHLRDVGVGAEVHVALLLDRSPQMIAAILAVMKAGGAYVPLDPDWPEERLSWLLTDAAPLLVLSTTALRGRLPRGGMEVLCVDAMQGAIDDSNLPSVCHADNAVYIIYTSGSTGQPKGVIATHGAVTNLAQSHIRDICRRHQLKQAHTSFNAPYVFDASVSELAMLLDGHTLHVLPDGVRQSPQALAAYLAAHDLQLLDTTPMQLRYLLDQQAILPRVVMLGGEAIDLALWQRLQAIPDTRFVNAYGPTEATIDATLAEIDKTHAQPLIGKPEANVQAWILDAALDLAPSGVPGELYIAGTGLARGYLGRAALTAERFLPNPYGAPGARMYRTGDLARHALDGSIVYLGRGDDQIKLRGFRIELGEIESALRRIETVREVAVVLRDEQLLAYLAAPAALDTAMLRAQLARLLPSYMLPSRFIVLENLPLTPIGKVDRRALPEPLAAAEADYAAPRNEREALLATIWQDVLKIERIGIHDDFFAVGGHSLLAAQLTARIRSELHCELSLRAVFEAPSVAQLAAVLDASREATTFAIMRRPADAAPPLSFGQQRLWFLDRFEEGSTAYNMSGAVRLRGELDLAALTRALNAVVARHESLRARFQDVDGKAIQDIVAELLIDLPLTDLSAMPDRAVRSQRMMQEESEHRFDLSQGPLLRARLLRIDAREHLLMLNMHHIVSDGWSVSVLISDLATLYAAFSQQLPSPLPELPIQYADYAAWQRARLEGSMAERQLDYWRKQLADAPAALELPVDYPRPTLPAYRGAVAHFHIGQDTLQGLHTLARGQQASLFMTLCAALQLLLSRYSGQADICIGTPVAGRDQLETQRLIGFFVNTLVLRTRIDSSWSFVQLLDQVRQTALDAYVNQDLPFERLMETLQPERQVNRSPLFQVMLVLLNTQSERQSLAGLEMEVVTEDSSRSQFDLTLNVQEEPDGLRCAFEYNTDLFSAATVARIGQHFSRLLATVVADGGASIGSIRLTGDAERHHLLHALNATASPAPLEQGIAALFEAQVTRAPNAIAAEMPGPAGNVSITYAELNARANRLAHRLREQGVGPDVLVAISAARTLDTLSGLLAILKAGGAYLPLDPAYPQERLRYMIADAQPRLLLTCAAMADSLRIEGLPQLLIDGQDDGGADTNLSPQGHAANLAYVIYTSGSTGQPKGVMNTRANLVNHLWAHIRTCRLAPGDRVLQFATLNFDASVEEIFPPLIAGATVVLRPEELMDGAAFTAFLSAQRISVVDLPTAYWHQWTDDMSAGALSLPTDLRLTIVGGEKAQPERLTQWLHLRGAERVRWLNTYGPTETTISVTSHECTADSPPGPIPIGRPMANAQAYILDAALEPVPQCVAGELYIGGAGLARGYLARPGLTAAAFLPDPHSVAGARMYRTGDLARWNMDGTLEYLGRVDRQAKIRGFRVEPDEVASALNALPQVAAATVMVREDEAGQPRLAAYVVARADSGGKDDAALRTALARTLPDYMLPSHIIRLDALPLTASGKIDQHRLPAPQASPQSILGDDASPHPGVENQLAAIWQAVLKTAAVGRHDNFFQLGGDSILSLQVVSRARQVGLQFSPRDLFRQPTVAGLAPLVQSVSSAAATASDAVGDVPLTPVQHWFFEQSLANAAHFNQSVLLDARIDAGRSVLNMALKAILQQHAGLRLRFTCEQGVWRQQYAKEVPEQILEVFSLPDNAAVIRHAAIIQAALDLRRGPLFRAVRYETPDGVRLLLVAHHLVVDAVSWRILLADLNTACAQMVRGEAIRLPAASSSYKDWAIRLSPYAGSTAVSAELPYWQRTATLVPLQVDFPAGANLVSDAVTLDLIFNEVSTADLLSSLPARGASVEEALLTALALAFNEWRGQSVLSILLEGHGREDLFDGVDLSRTVGWFTALYPVTLSLSSRAYGDALRQVKEQLRAVPAKGLGYGLLRYVTGAPALTTQGTPAVAFNYLGQVGDMFDGECAYVPAAAWQGADNGLTNARAHELEVDIVIMSGQLKISLCYGGLRFRAASIQTLADLFAHHLQGLIAYSTHTPDSAHVNTADFNLAGLDQDELDGLLDDLDEMEN